MSSEMYFNMALTSAIDYKFPLRSINDRELSYFSLMYDEKYMCSFMSNRSKNTHTCVTFEVEY